MFSIQYGAYLSDLMYSSLYPPKHAHCCGLTLCRLIRHPLRRGLVVISSDTLLFLYFILHAFILCRFACHNL